MTAGRWRRMEELFAQALERPASERASFLDQAVSGDETLRIEVEKLLAIHGQSSGFLEPDSAQRAQLFESIEDRLLVGSLLGPYRIEELLGGGGMGIVYRARDPRQEADVAIKVLRREALADPALRKRFDRECRAAAALDHPSIVRVLDFGCHEGVDFLVMEFVEGRTLRDLIAAGPLPYRDAVRYACQVVDALAAAHAKGVTHRDIKPANVMILPAGTVKVLDFGICQWTTSQAEKATSTQTQAGMLLGTAPYMSPEQAQGLPTGPRSDIFSFGALLYEMLTGREAFSEPTTVATLAAILHQEPQFHSGVTPEVRPLLARCLQKDPEKRFQTAADLLAALTRVNRALTRGRLATAALRAGATIRNDRSQWARWTLAAAGVAGLAWLVWGLSHRPSTAPTQAILTPDYVLSIDPAPSRDGTLFAYASDRAGQGPLDIWLQPLPKGDAVRLVHTDFDVRSPNFAPDGKTIVFRQDRGAGEICTVPVSGGPVKRIAPLGLNPRFSPDGKWIAYWAGPEGSTDLFSPGVSRVYVVPSGGGAPRMIASELPAAAYPVWTPDSKALLIPAPEDMRLGNHGVAIWVAPVDGGPARQAIPASRFREWRISGQVANANLFYQLAFPVGVSRNAGLILPTPIAGHTEIWEFPLAPRTWTSLGAPRHLTNVPSMPGFPAFGADGAVFFKEPTLIKTGLWALPVDHSSGMPSGSPRELVTCPQLICLPVLSRGGSKMLFTASHHGSGSGSLSIKDLPSGRETVLAADGADWNAALTHDGKYAFYSELSRETVNGHARLYRVKTSGGPAEVVCKTCPHFFDVSADGRYVLGVAFKPQQVVLVDLRTGSRTSLLRHSAWSLYHARFSPDGNWIAFTAQGGAPGTRMFVAPFLPGQEQPPEEWIAIMSGDGQDGPVAWSPRGDSLYFASERDGYRCLWIQRLRSSNKRPLGEPQPFQHFHSARASLKNITSSWFGFSVAGDKIVYELGERTGRIWMTH
jgi:Tol biopolymer transport system component/tRNA A-37 threonylcarbamoyl transferase component Bud32